MIQTIALIAAIAASWTDQTPPEHNGGCRKSSPQGECCHKEKSTGEVHCHKKK